MSLPKQTVKMVQKDKGGIRKSTLVFPTKLPALIFIITFVLTQKAKADYYSTPDNSYALHFAVWDGNHPQEYINISLIQEVPVSPYRHYDLRRIRDCIESDAGNIQCRINKSECNVKDDSDENVRRPAKLRTELSIFFTVVPYCKISEGPSNDWVSLMVRISCKSQTRILCKRPILSTIPTPSPTPIVRKDQPADEIPPPVFCYSDIIDARSSSQFDASTGARSGLYRRHDLSEYVSKLLFNNASFSPQHIDVHFGKKHLLSTFSFYTSKSGFGINDAPSKFVLQGCHVDECYPHPTEMSNSTDHSPWEDIHRVESNVFSSTTEKKDFYIPRRNRKEFRVYRLKAESAGWKDAGGPWGYVSLRLLRFCGLRKD